VQLNLRVLQPSRKRIREGDIFSLSPADGMFLHGAVVSIGANWSDSAPPCNMIYIYSVVSPNDAPPKIEELTPDSLLIPPELINNLPWRRGYFKSVGHCDVSCLNTLPVHAFYSNTERRLYDESGRPLHADSIPPGIPIGIRGLGSFATVDSEVSRALRLPVYLD